MDSVVRDLSASDRRNFSYSRLIRHQLSPRAESCLEFGVAIDLEKRLGIPAEATYGKGALLAPLSLAIDGRETRTGLSGLSGSKGGYLAQSDVMPDVIDLLRNRSLLLGKLGSQLLTVNRSISLPYVVSGATTAWVSEDPGSDLSDTTPSFGQKNLVPHSLMATLAYSNQLLQQTDQNVERILRRDIAAAFATAIDAAAIAGSGTQSAPLGLLYWPGISTISLGSNGAVPTFQNLIDQESAAATANVDESGPLAYLSTPGVRAKLKTVEELAGSGVMIWRSAPWAPGAQQVNSWPAYVTQNCPSTLSKGSSNACHLIAFGNWAELYVANCGTMAITIDRYKLKKRNMSELTCYLDVDVAVRTTGSFSLIKDALTA